MKEAQSWNELLAGIIRIPEERQRLAEALGVNQVTLTRWANGLAIPRVQHRRRLIDLVPAEYRESLKPNFIRMCCKKLQPFPPLSTPGLLSTSSYHRRYAILIQLD